MLSLAFCSVKCLKTLTNGPLTSETVFQWSVFVGSFPITIAVSKKSGQEVAGSVPKSRVLI